MSLSTRERAALSRVEVARVASLCGGRRPLAGLPATAGFDAAEESPEMCPAISESGPRSLTHRSGREYRSDPLSRATRAVRFVTGNPIRRETANAYYRPSPYPDM